MTSLAVVQGCAAGDSAGGTSGTQAPFNPAPTGGTDTSAAGASGDVASPSDPGAGASDGEATGGSEPSGAPPSMAPPSDPGSESPPGIDLTPPPVGGSESESGGESESEVPPTTPPAGGEPTPSGDLATHFAQFPCGVGFTALGNGGYKACFRLEGGQAACASPGQAELQPVLSGGAPVTDVLHVSAAGENDVAVVKTNGEVLWGPVGDVSTTPVVASGGAQVTGGRNTACALLRSGATGDVACWKNGTQAVRPALPANFDAVQVSAGYGTACALSSAGEVWCWDEGGNVPPFITATPAPVDFAEPMVFVSAGQDTICGIKQSGGLDCRGNFYASPYLPTEVNGGMPILTPGAFADAVAVQSGYQQGVVIGSDGSATYLGSTSQPPSTATGELMSGVSGAIAGGGDRGVACALTTAGEVFCSNGGGAATRVSSSAQVAACPY